VWSYDAWWTNGILGTIVMSSFFFFVKFGFSYAALYPKEPVKGEVSCCQSIQDKAEEIFPCL